MTISILTNSCIIPLFIVSSSDFDAEWFKDIGSMSFAAILILSVQPILNQLGEAVIMAVQRWYKRKYVYQNHTNNETDHIKYLELKAGPQY
jgi:hypothetical protein